MRKKLLYSFVGILIVAFGGLAAVLATRTAPDLGLDLQGGISVTMQAVQPFDAEGLDLAVDRIRERIDSLGVAEPEILRQGDDAIVVNLPGVEDQDKALALVQVTGQVYLRPVLQCFSPPDPNATTTTTGATTTTTTDGSSTTAGTATGSTTLPATTSAAPGPSRSAGPSSTPSTTPGASTTTPGSTSTTTDVGSTTTVPGGTTTTTEVVSDPTQTQILPAKDGGQCYVGPAGGTGEVFESDAKASILGTEGWGVTVSLKGGADGEGRWNAIAAVCYNGDPNTCPSRQLAIELDGLIISHPNVNQPSFSGDVQISGQFTETDAKDLARVLKSGALPVRLQTQAIQNVSPTLGKDSLRAAVVSGIVGVFLVLVFMVLYYRHLGVVVLAGLLVSASLLWTTVSILSATIGLTLSLSGITGIILSVGVTVDSYVVFFERLKDEVRNGRTMRNSAQRGFVGAWHTILIADLVSLIGAAVLWYLTVGSVRNFAFFLGLSTLCDLVVAYFFTRPAVLLLARTGWMARRKVMGIEVSPSATGANA